MIDEHGQKGFALDRKRINKSENDLNKIKPRGKL